MKVYNYKHNRDVMSKKERGRPTKYKEEYNEQARQLTLLGYTDKELAKFFNVNETTIIEWKSKHIDFSKSINEGKDIADAKVIDSLYNRAKGVTVTETTVIESEQGYTKKVTVKELPSDTKAAQIWITNRQRRRWKQNPDNFNDDGTDKQNNIVLNIGEVIKPLPNKEDEIEDFTKDE